MKNHNHQLFLKSFFPNAQQKEIKRVNGFILFKHWDGNMQDWRVDVFTPETFERMNEAYQEKFKEINND